MVEIRAGDNFFDPADRTVTVGAKVRWTNVGQRPHTVSSDTGVFESGRESAQWLRAPATFEYTFNQAGTFPYFCVLHGAAGGVGMAGVVRVVQAAAQPGAPSMRITAPAPGATFTAPADVSVTVEVQNFTLRPPTAGPRDPKAGHLQFYLDGNPDPSGPAPLGLPNIIHTPQTSATFRSVGPGNHRVTVTFSYDDHTPSNVEAAASVSFTVRAAETPAPAAPTATPRPAAPVTGTGSMGEGGFPWWLVALPAGIALLIAGGLLGLRRRLG